MGSAAEEDRAAIGLDALSPFDGRYRSVGEELSPYLSEGALMRARVYIELTYLSELSEAGIIRPFIDEERATLKAFEDLQAYQLERIKEIEASSHHDMHAVTVFLKEQLSATTLSDVTEFIHFGLTSEDVNNLAWRVNLQLAKHEVLVPILGALVEQLAAVADSEKFTPMLARTHGQPAIPTTFGKEMINFAMRLEEKRKMLDAWKFQGKLNGAVGNFNALALAYPKVDWVSFSDHFIRTLGLSPLHFTTQVNPNDDVVTYLAAIAQVNTIVHSLDQDMWRYISDGLVVQKQIGVGSSTMPQKINPIDFEHSEGMTEMANGMIEVLTARLPESRLQRDLSDSPLFRFLGEIHAATIDAWGRTQRGIEKSATDRQALHDLLWSNWAILSEPLQLLLRQAGILGGYETVRRLTQGKQFSENGWREMIEQLIGDLEISGEELLTALRSLTPDTYIGYAAKLTQMGIEQIKEAKE